MAGSQNNIINARALKQWHQLFVGKIDVRSVQAYSHWQDVERLGLPNNKNEHWKYTPLEGLLAHCFAPATTRTVTAAERDALSLTLDAYRLVFVDGRFVPALSDSNTGFWQIQVEEGTARQPLPAPIQPEIFLHLTESLSQQTTRIRLPTGKTASRLLYLLHISQGLDKEDKDTLSTLHYRHHIDIDVGATGQVIEHFVSLSAQAHFSGARTSINVGDNAYCHHIKLAVENRASYHFAHNDICVGRNAVVRSSAFILGAVLTRHQTSAQLNGEGSKLSISSLMMPSGQDISDTCSYLEHNKGHCLSRQLHKIIVRDRGKGIFHGLIKVAKYALKTDGKMINNNLLLNKLAEVNTKPQLEIYADDVKCSHGATVGRIDDEQIFYLRSRGINGVDAQRMIIYAFASEVTETIDHDAVRQIVIKCIDPFLQMVVA
ncbi:Fe-S cluster assembly protein SufD [Candidatus Hoaglandella endobia]|uniref:FeS cluster assembly protein SufD n=1 Tax=Candidatus Hoaglandella endobia TaxID=1778263 RepID=A0A143WTY4_9ENTR|nr:Fe-S cluster assembly protein SufD [Candidatus Hoaglandella endobia]CUX97165.1 FeS cluster assembly protein SufD [Candidatus Hoaglandella endobia]